MGNYDWLLTDGVILLEGYQPPLFPGLEYDAEYAAELVEKTGARIFRFPALSYYAYYPTKHYPTHPDLGGRDLLQETIDSCRKRGIKIIPYIPVGHAFLPADSDIEPYNSWAKLDEHGKRFTWTHHGFINIYHLCLNSPYREAIKSIVTEIVENYDVDGIYFDGPYQDPVVAGDICHCSYCSSKYETDGKRIPENYQFRDWNNQGNSDYLKWIIDVKQSVMRELNAIIKQKDIPHLFNNCGWLSNKYWGGDRYQDVDGFMFEGVHTTQEKLLHILLGRSTGKYIWSYISSYGAFKSEHLVTDVGGMADYPAIPLYGEELLNEGFSVVAGNGAPIYYGLNRIYHQQNTIEKVKTVNDFINNNADVLRNSKSGKFIGMWVSGQTRDWWYKNEDSKNEKYKCFIYGGFNILKDLFHQVIPFYRSAKSHFDISDFKIVLLPNTACMSETEADEIRNYVYNGGNIIATFQTSLFDEYGNKLDNFRLADVFGVDYIEKKVEFRRDSYMKVLKNHPVTECFTPGYLIPQDMQFLTVSAHNENEVLAYTSGVDHDIDISPAIIARNYGKGKILYLPGGIEALYRTSRFEDLFKLFDNAIKWMNNGLIPFNITMSDSEERPGGIIVNITEGDDFCLLHLVNNNSNNIKYSPVREKYVPVYNLKARMTLGEKRVKDVKLLYSGAISDYYVDNESVNINIEKLRHYECIKITFMPQ